MDTTTPQFQILTNVPLPPKAKGGKTGVSKYPFAQMEVGHSIQVSDEHKLAVRSALTAYRKNNKTKQFATRVLEGGGVGIWRVA